MIFGMIDGSDCGIQNLKAIELPMIIVICFVFRCFLVAIVSEMFHTFVTPWMLSGKEL